MRWAGLEEFRERLIELPAHLAGLGAEIVKGAARRAELVARNQYPEQSHTRYGTGNLRAGLRIDVLAEGPNGVIVRLRNNAPHAYIFEIGTRGKLRKTGRGWNRGAMPPGRVFIPAAMAAREVMYRELERMYEEATGLEVRRS